MEYHHPHFGYPQGHPMEHRPILHHHSSHPQMMESYMHPHPHPHAHPHPHLDFSDFPPHGVLPDEYEENPEALSRPRLTKEQVEVLETQFQAHPKPNSNVKRQLAYQTKLTLPRVANWFQNRRAKAKQQKKQEEFEQLQAMGKVDVQNGESAETTESGSVTPKTEEKPEESTEESAADEEEGEADDSPVQPAKTVPETMKRSTSAQEASWASLQRALNAAEAARAQSAMGSFNPITLGSPLQPSDMNSSNGSSQFPSSTFSEWTNSSVDWTGSSHSEQQFDFGLNIQTMPAEHFDAPEPQIMFNHSPEALSESISDEWVGNLQTPTLHTTQSHSIEESLSQPLPYPSYQQERRTSSPHGLNAGMENMGLSQDGVTPISLQPSLSPFARRGSESIDIAGRRKKPRPAMLGTAALRSRSYGAPPTMSPTIRYNTSSPVHHPLRHVKSTGASLNVHYGGIQKLRATQRSPLNISSFAEAEAFHSMMNNTSAVPVESHSLSPEERHTSIPMPTTNVEDADGSSEFYQLASNMQVNVSSPPSTPLKHAYFNAPHFNGSLAPPPSAPPQYAFFPDYTPPYSAGPLTAGSWSDAPLTSPDQASFGQAMNMPQPSYVSPMIHDYGSVTNFSHPFNSPPEIRSDSQKPTEFFIQEFPQQKEAHAVAAMHLSQSKPKNYVFANHTANDFSE